MFEFSLIGREIYEEWGRVINFYFNDSQSKVLSSKCGAKLGKESFEVPFLMHPFNVELL